MAKKKTVEPQREVTKRQLSKWQQQMKKQRIILGMGIFIVMATLSIIGVGWYVAQYQPMSQTVLKVNDVEFDMDYYVKALSYFGENRPPAYRWPLADSVLEFIERNEFIRQEAAKLDISVSQEEVDEKLNSYDPPLSKDYRNIIEAQVLFIKLMDGYIDQQVPVSAEQRHIMAMLLESESRAAEVRSQLMGGEDFGELAGEISLENISKTEGGDFGWRPEGLLTLLLGTSVPDDYAFNSEVGVLSQPIYDEEIFKVRGYWLINLVARDEAVQQALAQVMLLGSEEEARSLRARLEADEDFAALAEEFSQHVESRENGGNLDITSPDMLSPALREYIFDSEAEIGTLSQPIRDEDVATKGGYWLIQVVDIDDNRQIEDEDRYLLKSDTMTKWVEGILDNPENNVEKYLDDEKQAWAIRRAFGE